MWMQNSHSDVQQSPYMCINNEPPRNGPEHWKVLQGGKWGGKGLPWSSFSKPGTCYGQWRPTSQGKGLKGTETCLCFTLPRAVPTGCFSSREEQSTRGLGGGYLFSYSIRWLFQLQKLKPKQKFTNIGDNIRVWVTGQVRGSPELELPREGRCRGPAARTRKGTLFPQPSIGQCSQVLVPQEGTCSTSLAGAPPVGTKWPRETPLTSQTQSKAKPQPPPLVPPQALGNSFPFRGAAGLFPRLKLYPKTIYQPKEPFVLTWFVQFPYHEKLGQAFPLLVWFFNSSEEAAPKWCLKMCRNRFFSIYAGWT